VHIQVAIFACTVALNRMARLLQQFWFAQGPRGIVPWLAGWPAMVDSIEANCPGVQICRRTTTSELHAVTAYRHGQGQEAHHQGGTPVIGPSTAIPLTAHHGMHASMKGRMLWPRLNGKDQDLRIHACNTLPVTYRHFTELSTASVSQQR
jgi:hypothetical protein